MTDIPINPTALGSERAAAAAATLRTYAKAFLAPRRDAPASALCLAAAEALQLRADLIELAADSRCSDELIGIRVRNTIFNPTGAA